MSDFVCPVCDDLLSTKTCLINDKFLNDDEIMLSITCHCGAELECYYSLVTINCVEVQD